MAFDKILLIDDDEDDQEIFLSAVKEISSSVNYNYCSSATEALDKLISHQLKPELIFLDLNMPMMNGQQFLSHIKQNKELSSIPVIVFTTSSDPQTKKITKDLGAYDFITKPGNYDHLKEILKPFIS